MSVSSIQAELAAAGLPPLPRRAWLEVDCSGLAANARALREALDPRTKLGIVVKADGYGHGIIAAARAAVLGGADVLLVATADEGTVLRSAGVGGRIVLLYPIPADGLAAAAEASLELSVMDENSLQEAVEFARSRSRTAAATGQELPVHLAVDTGMTRGGFSPSDARPAAEALASTQGLRLAGTWSHLAAPEDEAAVFEQQRRFDASIEEIERGGISAGLRHLAASGGLLGRAQLQYDMVRVGLAFYGHVPKDLPLGERGRVVAPRLQPALRLLAQPVSIQRVPSGSGVGYGFDWRATRSSIIVTLPVGYADGWARSSSPGSWAVLRGARVPIVGRVSSDAVAVDATDAGPIGPDDGFVLLGSGSQGELTVGELAELRGTIPWEVLDGLGPRLPRVYRSEGAIVGVRYLDDRVRWAPGVGASLTSPRSPACRRRPRRR